MSEAPLTTPWSPPPPPPFTASKENARPPREGRALQEQEETRSSAPDELVDAGTPRLQFPRRLALRRTVVRRAAGFFPAGQAPSFLDELPRVPQTRHAPRENGSVAPETIPSQPPSPQPDRIHCTPAVKHAVSVRSAALRPAIDGLIKTSGRHDFRSSLK
ncbi:hypothetical protein MTO96_018320 [Rhipicephalus appendiculatus]